MTECNDCSLYGLFCNGGIWQECVSQSAGMDSSYEGGLIFPSDQGNDIAFYQFGPGAFTNDGLNCTGWVWYLDLNPISTNGVSAVVTLDQYMAKYDQTLNLWEVVITGIDTKSLIRKKIIITEKQKNNH